MTYRTLGELRGELQARLGMGGMGSSGGNQTLLNSFLRNGQAQLYWMTEWNHLKDYQDKTLGVGQNLIDYPDTGTLDTDNSAERDRRVLRLECPINGQYMQLVEGITTDMWSTMDTQSDPRRFERYAQIMVYPKANAIYTVRVWFVADLQPFTQDGHVATLDDEMILLHATTNAKAHYRQPDAKLYEGQLDNLLARIKGQTFGSNGVYRRANAEPIERRPLLLGRDA